jgi:hypothetical protein
MAPRIPQSRPRDEFRRSGVRADDPNDCRRGAGAGCVCPVRRPQTPHAYGGKRDSRSACGLIGGQSHCELEVSARRADSRDRETRDGDVGRRAWNDPPARQYGLESAHLDALTFTENRDRRGLDADTSLSRCGGREG